MEGKAEGNKGKNKLNVYYISELCVFWIQDKNRGGDLVRKTQLGFKSKSGFYFFHYEECYILLQLELIKVFFFQNDSYSLDKVFLSKNQQEIQEYIQCVEVGNLSDFVCQLDSFNEVERDVYNDMRFFNVFRAYRQDSIYLKRCNQSQIDMNICELLQQYNVYTKKVKKEDKDSENNDSKIEQEKEKQQDNIQQQQQDKQQEQEQQQQELEWKEFIQKGNACFYKYVNKQQLEKQEGQTVIILKDMEGQTMNFSEIDFVKQINKECEICFVQGMDYTVFKLHKQL